MTVFRISLRRLLIPLSLKGRVYLVNFVLLFITLTGAILMIWYTYKIESVFTKVITRNVHILQATDALGTALVDQKGFVAYYFLDDDPAWLDRLAHYRDIFSRRLTVVKEMIREPWEHQIIDQVEADYRIYVTERDRVIDLYREGETEKGLALHKDVRQSFFHIRELCEQFSRLHARNIAQAIDHSRDEANHLRLIALVAIICVTLLSLLVNYIFARHILGPIRTIISQVDTRDGAASPGMNEMDTLTKSVLDLKEDAALTHIKLQKSQDSLMQSEKMALLGKLAASTAHSIRNPLTSVKMRLFSLNRSGEFSDAQQEDFAVISSEIMQINRIVENFLEFARPPRLVFRHMSPSEVVDNALTLLTQRLASYHVTPVLIRKTRLPGTLIDPDQLKEVLVNIIINACEAMKNGGVLTIRETEDIPDHFRKLAIIRIADTGEGVSQDIRDRIFDPFFTTKKEGTGLGLSIAFNIIHEHGGWMDVTSDPGSGACFAITLPIKDPP